MRLTADVALVGGGSVTGFGLSNDFDCHVYLLDGGADVALIDTGMGTPAGMRSIFDNAATDGVDPDRITYLLLTHYHTDHAGGAGPYRERLGAQTAIGAAAAKALAAGDGEATQFDAAKASGMFPNEYEFAACPSTFTGRWRHVRDRPPDCSLPVDARPLRRTWLLPRHRWCPDLPLFG